jgi:hypothetical protein
MVICDEPRVRVDRHRSIGIVYEFNGNDGRPRGPRRRHRLGLSPGLHFCANGPSLEKLPYCSTLQKGCGRRLLLPPLDWNYMRTTLNLNLSEALDTRRHLGTNSLRGARIATVRRVQV